MTNQPREFKVRPELEPDLGKEFSDEEVLRRWVNVYPPRTLDLEDEKLVKAWIDYHLKDTKLIQKYRERLQDLGWFMKDLNPVAAGIAATPETSPHTSFRQRMENAKEKDAIEDLKAAREGTVQGSRAAKNIEADHWLAPIEDRRNAKAFSSDREGMLETFSLGSYALLVEYTARLFPQRKSPFERCRSRDF